jgi:hypothetical protein
MFGLYAPQHSDFCIRAFAASSGDFEGFGARKSSAFYAELPFV